LVIAIAVYSFINVTSISFNDNVVIYLKSQIIVSASKNDGNSAKLE